MICPSPVSERTQLANVGGLGVNFANGKESQKQIRVRAGSFLVLVLRDPLGVGDFLFAGRVICSTGLR